MFSQFQAHYPTGSLIAELVQIHDGYYIVKATVQVGGVTLATGLSAATTIEQAEDRARLRALAVLGIEPALEEHSQAHLLEQPSSDNRLPQSPEAAFADSELSKWSLPAAESRSPTETSPTYPAAKRQQREPRPDLDLEYAASPSKETAPPAHSPSPSANGRSQPLAPEFPAADLFAATANPVPAPQGKTAQPPSETQPPSPLDLSDIIAQTSVELKRLGWTNAQGRTHLQQTYGKRSRQQLTDEELLDFLNYLQSQPSETEPSF